MASFRRVAIIDDCWQVHRHDHRILIEQPGVTSGPPINASGSRRLCVGTPPLPVPLSPSQPCRHQRLVHRHLASVAGSALKFISATVVVNIGGYACGTHGSRMTSTVYARLRCCATLSPIALLTLLELPHQHQSSHRNVAKPRLVSQLLDTTMLITFD
jgi:hypothetical protein